MFVLMCLSYVKPGSDERVTVDESEMEVLWSGIKDSRLTLWCTANEVQHDLHCYFSIVFPCRISKALSCFII